MNSDQIRERFGSYNIELLIQGQTQRLANLYSIHEGVNICRTLALTQFQLPVPKKLLTCHKQIHRGASIGATLRMANWQVIKSDVHSMTVTAGNKFTSLSAGTIQTGEMLTLQVYTLQVVSSDNHRHTYATIAEAYHPAHIPVNPNNPQINSAEFIEKSTADTSLGLSVFQRETLNALLSALT